MFGKFQPIKVDDEKLIEKIDILKEKRRGFTLLIEDAAQARYRIQDEIGAWFEKVEKKYNVPKRYRGKLTYFHDKKELRLED